MRSTPRESSTPARSSIRRTVIWRQHHVSPKHAVDDARLALTPLRLTRERTAYLPPGPANSAPVSLRAMSFTGVLLSCEILLSIGNNGTVSSGTCTGSVKKIPVSPKSAFRHRDRSPVRNSSVYISNSLDDIPPAHRSLTPSSLSCQLSRDVVRLFSSTIVPG